MKLVIASVISLLSFSALAAPEGTLSVHILNQQTGLPSPGVQIELDKQQGESWQHIATGKTDADGRIKSLYPQAENMAPGVYKVTFKTGDYFKSQNMNTFFPVIPVIFNVNKQNQKTAYPAAAQSVRILYLPRQLDDPSRYPANACAASAGVTLSSHHDVHANARSLSL
ncbi:transthyretin family protein [Klebsiella pneumoniae]|uniref:5-hydroxyisourate hydrolase n=5 Tax=Klebsiella pneumoniae complex TaxID=3390273 RepID=A0A378F626_KLEPN|nr:transthyretin family protein [Klebsiella pneumoniae]